MSRSKRLSASTWVLALALGALGVYVYRVEVIGGARRENSEKATKRLLTFPADAASELKIVRKGTGIALKEIGVWKIAEPIQADADEMNVKGLLANIEQANIDREVDTATGDLARYGLANPTVLRVTSGTRSETLEIGKKSPASEFVYVRRAGGPVLLVDARIQKNSESSLYDLREKQMLSIAPDEAQDITFTYRGRIVQLARRESSTGNPRSKWMIVSPLHAVADRGQIERMVETSANLKAEEFLAEDQSSRSRFGLANPWGSARIESAHGTKTILLGKSYKTGALDRYYACFADGGPVFGINGNLAEDVRKPSETWRDKHATDFERKDVAELRIISEKSTLVIARQGDSQVPKWGMADFKGQVAEGMGLGAAAKMPTALQADSDIVERLIGRLSSIQAAAFKDDLKDTSVESGLMRPSLKVAALDKAGKLLASVSFGAVKGGQQYATSSYLGTVFLAPNSEAAGFVTEMKEIAARSQ